MAGTRTRKTQTTKKTSQPRVSTRTRAKKAREAEVRKQKRYSLLDYFKVSETYTSLILGIVVVIIATVLLIAFFKNQHIAQITQPSQQISYDRTGPTNTPAPTEAISTPSPTITMTPTPTLFPTPTEKPSVGPTKPTIGPTKPAAVSTPKPEEINGGTYVVKAGDDLWHIAQAHYNDGYQWVTIAKANNLAEPGNIHVGDKLVLPQVSPNVAQNVPPTTVTNKISGTNYTIQKGDDLWNIAVRAYGDGYKWVDIANANGYTNPDLIHSGNVLKIPR